VRVTSTHVVASILMLAGITLGAQSVAQGRAVDEAQAHEMEQEIAISARSIMTRAPGITLDEARQRARIEGELPPHLQALQAEFARRLLEVRLMQATDLYVRVSLQGDAPVAPRTLVVPSGRVRVEFSTGHPFTEEAFAQRLRAISREAAASIPGYVGLSGDAHAHAASVRIRGDEAEARRYRGALSALQEKYGLALRFQTLSEPERNY